MENRRFPERRQRLSYSVAFISIIAAANTLKLFPEYRNI